MAISQILYGQYHIWDIFGFFFYKQHHEQGTRSAKMGAADKDQ